MALTKAGREHEKEMEQMRLVAEAQKRREENAAKAEADRMHYENEERKRNAEERKEAQNRASQERIEIAKAKAEADKVRSEAEVIKAENDLKIALAQKQVEATEKEQEGLSNRTKIEEEEETARAQISADRDVAIAKSADEASVKIREQQRLENQFLETEITKRGELTLEFMKEQLKMLDKDRERKHLEFEKLIDSTREKQRELQESFDKTGNIELIAQISDCETTLKQYIAKDKRDEKEYNSNKLIMNEKMNQLFITSDSGANE